MSIDSITTFLGWCLLFNITLVLLLLFGATVFKDFFARVNSKMFGVSEQHAKEMMFHLFYQFRLLVAFFNLIPWLVLYFMF